MTIKPLGSAVENEYLVYVSLGADLRSRGGGAMIALYRGEGIRGLVDQVAGMDGFDEVADIGFSCRTDKGTVIADDDDDEIDDNDGGPKSSGRPLQ